MRYYCTPTRMTMIKKTDVTKCWQKHGKKLSYLAGGNITIVESLLKRVGQFLKKLKNFHFTHNSILSLNSLRSSAQRSIHIPSFTTTSGPRYICWLILNLNYFSSKDTGLLDIQIQKFYSDQQPTPYRKSNSKQIMNLNVIILREENITEKSWNSGMSKGSLKYETRSSIHNKRLRH